MIELLHTIASSTTITTNEVPNLPTPSTHGVIQQALAIVFAVIGAFSLLIVTVSGLRYVLSAGDPQKTARAKDGIIYALVGLAIAIFAESIVYFVVSRL
jgi:hypothetical protein